MSIQPHDIKILHLQHVGSPAVADVLTSLKTGSFKFSGAWKTEWRVLSNCDGTVHTAPADTGKLAVVLDCNFVARTDDGRIDTRRFVKEAVTLELARVNSGKTLTWEGTTRSAPYKVALTTTRTTGDVVAISIENDGLRFEATYMKPRLP